MIALVLSIVILVSPVSPLVSAASFTDTVNADFAQGTPDNTENVNDAVRLTSGKTQGLFTSQVFDTLLITSWDNLVWTENEPTFFKQENDNVGSEPNPLVDGSSRKGTSSGSLADVRVADGVYEEIGEDVGDNTLNWTDNIENIAAGFDNYTAKIKGYTSGDSENVGVYIWENQDGTWGWRFLDNITDTEKTITFTIPGENIENYLVGENIGIRYLESTADLDQTIAHIDLCIVEENITYKSEVKLQVRASADNSAWTSWRGPDGTSSSYFTNGAGAGYSTLTVGMENIPDNRYVQYRAYFSAGAPELGGANGPVLYDVTINYTNVRPTLQSPGNGSFDNDNTPTFRWDSVEGASEYRLYIDNKPNFSTMLQRWPTENQYALDIELADNLYYWKVRARDGAGNSSLLSYTWTVWIDAVPPTAPAPASPENNTTLADDQPLFTWTNVNESGISYKLVIDNDNDFSSPVYLKTGLTENSHEIENKLLENFSPYYWRVASNDNANDNWSGFYKFWLNVPPYSNVCALTPYWDNVSPRTITATANDNDGTVENVELWYRYRENQDSSWEAWIFYDNQPAPYSFTFLFDQEGLYQFYSRAWDERGNRENAPENASTTGDTGCGHDNTAPAIPTPVTPDNNSVVQTSAPTFTWTSVSSLSPVVYELVIDNENDFDPAYYVYYKSGILENSHPAENSLEIGVYYWRVKAKDNAGNENIWSENFTLTISVWHSIETWTGTVNSPPTTGWYAIETWTGTAVAPNKWNRIDSWTGYASSGGIWKKLETWTATVVVPVSGWHFVETWTGAVSAPILTGWYFVESWTGTTDATVQWKTVESWAVTVNAAVVWRKMESWTGTVASPAVAGWTSTENWTGTANAPFVAPTLLTPFNGENTNNTTPNFDWDNALPADNFCIQVDNDNDFSSPVINTVVTSSSYTPGTGLADNLYRWRVRISRNNENSPWSENRSFRIDIVKPAIPTLVWPVDGENLKDNTPNLDWNPVPENSYPLVYNVQIAENDKYFHTENIVEDVLVTDDNWNVTTALPDNIYYWKVRVKDNAGNGYSAYSNRRMFRIDTVPPAAPPLVLPENNGWTGENAMLSWGSVGDNSLPVLYNLVIAEELDFSSVVENIWTENTNWTGTLYESPYWWHVKAKDNAGNEGGWSENRTFTIDNFTPSPVVLYSPANNSRCSVGDISFKWQNAADDDSGVVRYWIQIDNENNFDNTYFVHQNDNVAENTYTYALSSTGTYYWRVRAIDNVGNQGNWSENYLFVTCRWLTIETWGGTISAPLGAGWLKIESWAGAIATTTGWHAIESWTGTASSPSTIWRTVENWSGTVNATAPAWHKIEGWSGTVATVAPAWKSIENWSGTVSAPLAKAWYLVESWTGTVATVAPAWKSIENWSGTVNATAPAWHKIEGWSGTVSVATSTWQVVESWSGTVSAPLAKAWYLVESWTGTVSAPITGWHKIENWSGTVSAPILWRVIEGWSGTVSAPLAKAWYLVESWTGTVSAPLAKAWYLVESWTGTVSAPLAKAWYKIEGWSGTVTSPTKTGWVATENWTGTANAPVPKPSLHAPTDETNTTDTTPFLDWDNAQAADNFQVQIDNEPSFTAPYIYNRSGVTTENQDVENSLADNQYYWRVRAFRNNENSLWSDNWMLRVDTVTPAAPTLTSPASGENVNDNTPLLKWQAPPENSFPLLYWIQVDNEATFEYPIDSGWVSGENWAVDTELADNVYYWHAKTKDNAGKFSNWCTYRSFRVDISAPAVPTPLSPIGDTWSTNNPNLDWGTVTLDNLGNTENSLPVRYQVWLCESPSFVEPHTVYDSGWITADNWVPPENLSEVTGKRYYWRVQAKDNAGNMSENSSTENFRIDISAPLKVQLRSPENNSSLQGAVTFEWENATELGSGVARYWIQIDNEPSFDNTYFVKENDNVTENTYTYALPGTGTYYWRVRAIDNVGYQSDWSDNYQLTLCTWRTIETWAGSTSTTASWRIVESWTFPYTYASIYDNVKGILTNFSDQKNATDNGHCSTLSERGRELIKVSDNRGTTTQTTTSSDWVELTGTSVLVSPSENSYLLIDFHAAFSSSTAGDNVEFRLQVGSTEVAKGKSTMSSANADTTVSLTRAYKVTAGAYTVRAQWRRASGSGTLSCVERSLNAAAVPESLMSVYENRDNTTKTYDGTTFDDLTGPLNVSADKSSYLLIDFHAAFSSNTAGDNVEFRLWVDGAEVAKGRSNIPSANAGITTSLTKAYNVTPGTHIVKAQWRVEGVGPINCWERSLNVVVVPGGFLPVFDNRNTTPENTTSTSFVDLTGPSIPVTVNESSYLLVDFHAAFDSNTAGDVVEFKIFMDNTEIAKGRSKILAAGADATISLTKENRVTPGTHIVNVRWRVEGTGPINCWERSLNIAAISNFYDMEIAENIDNLPSGHEYYLEARYSLSNENDQFRVQVWNGSTWEARGENLNKTSLTEWSYQLQPDEIIGGENVRVKFIDVNANADNSCNLYIDYLWVRTVKSGWSGTVNGTAQWHKIEGWAGTVSAPSLTGWVKIESWTTGTVGAPRYWFTIETWTGTAAAPVPKPTLLPPPSNGSYSMDATPTFDWDNSQVVDNFNIQVDNDADFSLPEIDNVVLVSNFTPETGLADNLYYWRVMAFKDNENSGWSENWTFRIDTLAPAAPALVSPDNNIYVTATPTFDWDPVEENSPPVSYYVAISDNSEFPYENENTQGPGNLSGLISNDNWTVDTPLSEDVTYYWHVHARDVLGQWGDWSETRQFLVDNTTPTKVENLSPENNIFLPAGEAFTFMWDNASDAKSGVVRYWIQIDNEPSFSTPRVRENDNVTENTYTYALSLGTYYWRVRAVDNVSIPGAWSDNFCISISTWRKVESWSGTTGAPVPAPTLLSPENNTHTINTTPTFYWDNAQAADNFTFQLDNDNNFGSTIVSITIENDNYTPSGPLGDNLYYWRVCTSRAGTPGAWSNYQRITIDTLSPAAPTLVSPNNGVWTTAIPNLDWNPVLENSQPVLYYVAISDNPAFPENEENKNSGWITSDNWTPPENALPAGDWYWRVNAKDNAGNEDGWSENRLIRVDNAPPTPVILLSPDNNTEITVGATAKEIIFQWVSSTDSGSGVAKYWIQVDNDDDFSSPTPLLNENLTDNNKSKSLYSGTYYWRVKAIDNVGNQTDWSDNFKLMLRRWWKIEGWSGIVKAPIITGWRKIENWTGTAKTSASWHTVESWNGTVVGYVTWRKVDSWTGTVRHLASWKLIETRNGTVKDMVTRAWYKIEQWAGGVNSPHGWTKVERWGASGGPSWPSEPSGPSVPPSVVIIGSGTVGWATVVEGGAPPSEWKSVESWANIARVKQKLVVTGVPIVNMGPGSSGTADFSARNLSVVDVYLAIKQDASAGTIGEVRISFDEENAIPDGTQAPSGMIYKYFVVDATGVPDQAISQAVITIRVEKSWVESEKIDLSSLRVLRLGANWDALTTERLNDDQDYYYFKAYSPGFSLFAVVGQLKVETPPIATPIGIFPTAGPTQMRPPVELFAVIGAVGVAVGLMAYRRSSAFRYNSMVRQFKLAATEPVYTRLQPNLSKIRKKIRGVKKASLMRTAGPLWKPPAPEMVPVRMRLTKPELLAVRRLEKFIEARREEAPIAIVKKKKIAKIRRRLVKEEVALKRLERFMEKRRKVAKIPKRKKPKK